MPNADESPITVGELKTALKVIDIVGITVCESPSFSDPRVAEFVMSLAKTAAYLNLVLEGMANPLMNSSAVEPNTN